MFWCYHIIQIKILQKYFSDRMIAIHNLILFTDIILHPVFPLASPEVVWRRVPKGKGRWWISNDLTSSYWQVWISEESQGITTFISEFGQFKSHKDYLAPETNLDSYWKSSCPNTQNLQISYAWLMIQLCMESQRESWKSSFHFFSIYAEKII